MGKFAQRIRYSQLPVLRPTVPNPNDSSIRPLFLNVFSSAWLGKGRTSNQPERSSSTQSRLGTPLGSAEESNCEVPNILLATGPVVRFVCRKGHIKTGRRRAPGLKVRSAPTTNEEIDEGFLIVLLQLPTLPGQLTAFTHMAQDGVALGHGSPIVDQSRMRTQANSLEGRLTHLVLCVHETLD